MQFPKRAFAFFLLQSTLGYVSQGFVAPAARVSPAFGTRPTPSVARFSEVQREPSPSAVSVSVAGLEDAPEEPETIELTSDDPSEDPALGIEDVVAELAEGTEVADLSEEPSLEVPSFEDPEDIIPEAPERFCLYVSNLPFTVTVEQLQEMFMKCGEVKRIIIPRKPGYSGSRGYAFVDMSSREEMEKAMEELAGTELDGRTIGVKESLPKSEQTNRANDDELKLYVGNLPYGVEKRELAEFFGQFGEVGNIYIARDEMDNDRGYGFINMMNEADLMSAIENANGATLKDRQLTVRKRLPKGVQYGDQDDALRIYMGNISFETSLETLTAMFEEYGEVDSIRLNLDNMGRSRGFGFVSMKPEDAEKAIEGLNGKEVDGRMIKVSIAERRTPQARVFCGNFDFNTDPDKIRELFEQYGPVKNVYFPRDEFGNARGFSIITMDRGDAPAAIDALNGMNLDGRTLSVSPARARGEAPPPSSSTKIYVGNLAWDSKVDNIRQMFESYGEVKDCFLPQDPEFGGGRGYGFVTMSPESAQAAIAELDGIQVDGRPIKVSEAGVRRPRNAPPPQNQMNQGYDGFDGGFNDGGYEEAPAYD